MKKCEICGTAMNDDIDVCPECGAAVEAKPNAHGKTCPVCGASVAANKKFCPQCGAKMSAAKEPAEAAPAENTAPAEESVAVENTEPAEESVAVENTEPAEEPIPAENTEPAESSAPAEEKSDGKTCPVCGASVAANKKFCPQCGAKMSAVKEPAEAAPAENIAPAEESVAVGNTEPAESPAPAEKSDGKTCPICGAIVAANKKFCPNCGAKMPEEKRDEEAAPVTKEAAGGNRICQTCGASVAANKKFCPNCGSKMPEEQKPEFSYCPECGAKVMAGKKFCPECGTPITENVPKQENKQPVSKADYKPTGEAATTVGKVKQLLPSIGIALTLILTVVFMFVPFLSVKVTMMGAVGIKFGQSGVTGLGVLFTGKSELVSMGEVSEAVMRLVGAGYVLLILALIWYILFAISSILRYNAKSLKHQLIMSAVLTAVSLFLMVLMIIAKSQINSSMGDMGSMAALVKTSWFMGAVGLFIVNALMLAYAIVMRVLYKPALDRPALTPELLGKKTRRALIIVDVIVLIACIVIPIVTGCSGSKGKSPDKAEEISSSGSFSIKCDESHSERDEGTGMTATYYYGVKYFVYTPQSDGTVTVTVTNNGSGNDLASMTTMRAVDIGEYGEIYDLYREGGNYAVLDEMSMDQTATFNVEAGTKYCIAFGVASIYKNEKVSVSYTFDNGGTNVSGGGGTQQGGDSRRNATAVSLDSRASTGTISGGNSKWYKFSPSSSGTYNIASTTSTGDPDLYVYDSVSSNFYMSKDEGTGNFDLDVNMSSGTTYYIEIRASGSSSCTFVITKNGGGTLTADGSSREKAITVIRGADVSTGTMAGNDSKFYKFTPSLSGTYSITSMTYSGDPDLYLYNSISGSCTNDDDSVGGFNLDVYMYSGTTYYLEIKAAGSSSCTFVVDNSGSSSLADGSSKDRAITISDGVDVSTGTFSSHKWYKFIPSVTGTYVISGHVNSGDPDIMVYLGTTEIDRNSSGGFDDVQVELISDNTYYIYLYNGGSLTFSIDRVVFDRANAMPITFGEEVSTGTLNSSGKWYKITPLTSFTCAIHSLSYAGDPDVRVYSDTSTSTTASGNSVGWDDVVFDMYGEHTYYIQIYGSGSSLNFIVDAVDGISREYAIEISLGSEVNNGTLTSNGRWYEFTPSISGTYVITSNEYSGDPNVCVYVGSLSGMIAYNFSSGWVDVEASMTAGMTYYIQVYNGTDETACEVTFTVETVAGYNRANAIELEPFTDVSTGSLSSGGNKWYKFTPMASGSYIIANATYTGDPDVNVYAGNSESIYVSDTTSNAWRDLTVSMTAGTTYFIKINMVRSGSLTFSVDPVVYASGSTSRSSATAVTLGQYYNTDTLTSGGKWFKFTPPTDGFYIVKGYNATSDPNIKIQAGETATGVYVSNTNYGWEDVTAEFSSTVTYYINIYRTGSVIFVIEKTPDGSSREQAISLTLGVSVSTGNISSSNAYKWYKFTPAETGSYRIASSTSTGDPDLYVYNSLSSSSENDKDANSGGFNKTVTLNYYTTYYIGIKAYAAGSSATFSITKA